MPHQSSNEVP